MVNHNKTCNLCGHVYDAMVCGVAYIDGKYFCHTDSHSCYKEQTLTSHLKFRDGDQQLPEKNDLPDIQSLVLEDIESRRNLGISRYGTALQPFNGRDMLRDAYEEAVDLAIYLRGVMYERDNK